MGLEDIASSITDFAGDISENINDAVVDIGEFCKDVAEGIGDKGMEALENGDLKGAVEHSDMPKEDKEAVKELVEGVNVPSLMLSGAKVVGGSVAAIGALATPGFQPAGVAGLSLAVNGAREIVSQWNSSQNIKKLADA